MLNYLVVKNNILNLNKYLIMKKIFIKGYGLFKFENPFRVKKMNDAAERIFWGGCRRPNQETDLN